MTPSATHNMKSAGASFLSGAHLLNPVHLLPVGYFPAKNNVDILPLLKIKGHLHLMMAQLHA